MNTTATNGKAIYGTDDAIEVLAGLIENRRAMARTDGSLHADDLLAIRRLEQALFLVRGTENL